MHLPFTFTTGEALLYHTSYPLHGFPDSFQGKAKGTKSKKGKLDKSSSDDLDPKSLLGALMSQDGSVYVSQPDPAPMVPYHSGLFSMQQSNSDGFSGFLSGDSWQIVSNTETGICSSTMTSFDPLLDTLDSLSLDEGETCSNSELFSALENLGLNAEDLELLLLDKRMVQVELDPNHIPTLSDLLTNNEILSYIHNSLESGPEGGQHRGCVFEASDHPADPNSSQSVSQEPCLTLAVPAALPILQLSQQMQQHISAGELVRTVDTSTPKGPWVVHHHPNNHTQSNGEHLNSLLELQQVDSHRDLLPVLQHEFGVTNDSAIPNGHAAFPPHVEVAHTEDGTELNGGTSDVAHFQSLLDSCLPDPHTQCPASSSALDLEQLLGLSPPQHDYMINSSTENPAPSKVRVQQDYGM